MTSESDPGSVLYASVSCGSTILADLLPNAGNPSHDSCPTDELYALAAACLDDAPRFHLFYSHTSSSRIYAFVMADPLLFFAISHESLGRPSVLLFLNRLLETTVDIARRRVASGDPISDRCLQNDLLPMIRSLAEVSVYPLSEEEKLPTSPSLISKKERKKKKLKCDVRANELEISVSVNDGDADLGLGAGARKSVQRIWRQQVRIVLLIDLMVCSVLFGIWLSVCKGFQCIED